MHSIPASILLLQGLSSPVLGRWPFESHDKCQDSWTFEISAPRWSCAGREECPSFKCEVDFQDRTSIMPNINCYGEHDDHDFKVTTYDWESKEIVFTDVTDPNHWPITFGNDIQETSQDASEERSEHSQNIFPFIPVIPRYVSRSKGFLKTRDSITINIHSETNNSTVSNAANNAKFEVVNNAKNANIAMGDNSNHTALFSSFGDKNMINSTGSNTGGWNTKNRGSTLNNGDEDQHTRTEGDENEVEGSNEKRGVKREEINLDVGAVVRGSNVSGSANGNVIELYVPGDHDNVVNITIKMEGVESNVEGSGNRNLIRIFIGDMTMGELRAAKTVMLPVNRGEGFEEGV